MLEGVENPPQLPVRKQGPVTVEESLLENSIPSMPTPIPEFEMMLNESELREMPNDIFQ